MSAPRLDMVSGHTHAFRRGQAGGEGRLSVQAWSWASLDEACIEAWAGIEPQAVVPDPGLSPFFLLPAMRCLRVSAPHVFAGEGRGLLAFSLFYPRRPNRRFPLSHLEAFRFSHSLQAAGWLVDRQAPAPVHGAVRDFLASSSCSSSWQGLHFPARPLWVEDFERCLARSARRGRFSLQETDRFALAAIRLRGDAEIAPTADGVRDGFECVLDRTVLVGCRESGLYRRQWRQLDTGGQCRRSVSWLAASRCVARPASACLSSKIKEVSGVQGIALLARLPGHVQFFREMVRGFAARRRVFFTELVIGDAPIASACYLVSGTHAFNFKIDWSYAYARYSPMILNERMLVRFGVQAQPGLSVVHAVNTPGDYIESLWPDRLQYASGGLLAGRLAHALRPALSMFRRRARYVRCASSAQQGFLRQLFSKEKGIGR